MSMNNTIQVALEVNGWTAKFGGDHAQKIVSLFGSDTLPTAFGPSVPVLTVMLSLQERHPDAVIFRRKRAA